MKKELDVELVKKLYITEHMGVAEVARTLNVPPSRVTTILKKHGIKKTQSEIVDDRKLRLINDYGVACSLQTDAAKKKCIETCIRKRGVEHHSKDPAVKAKKTSTYLEHYGVDHYAKTPEYLEKCAATLSKKYGEDVSFPLQSEEVKKQKNNTMMERYGTTSAVAIRWKKYYEEKAKLEKGE